MESTGIKIAVSGLIFLIIGLVAVALKAWEGGHTSDNYKVFFGLCIFCGAPTTVIGLLIAIWS